MKHLFLFLFLSPALLFAQNKILEIPWIGQNKEYLYIEKKIATLNKGQFVQEFAVKKYVKNKYFILLSRHISGYLEQKYNIVLCAQDKLILEPEGIDIFKLSRLNEDNQYVFETNLEGITFVKLHFSTTIIASSLDINISITLDIDSARNSRVKLHDDYMNETNVVTTIMSKNDYNRFVSILNAFDIDSFPEEFMGRERANREPEGRSFHNYFGIIFRSDEAKRECSNSYLEIQYNDQTKKCKSCAIIPFYYPLLEDFLMNYISMKSYQSGKNPKLWY